MSASENNNDVDIDYIISQAEHVKEEITKRASMLGGPLETVISNPRLSQATQPQVIKNHSNLTNSRLSLVPPQRVSPPEEKEAIDVDNMVAIAAETKISPPKRPSMGDQLASAFQWPRSSVKTSSVSHLPPKQEDYQQSTTNDIQKMVQIGEKQPGVELVGFAKMEENIVVSDVDRVIDMAENVIRNSVVDLTGSIPELAKKQ